MARIAGVNLPQDRPILIALTHIYGIGRSLAQRVLEAASVSSQKRTKDLSENEINRLRQEIEGNYQVEGNLRGVLRQNIKRLRDINSYRGLRHKAGLPVRGQRTQTNARTRKGRKITIGGTSSHRSQASPT
jgi:small subunit ribosomal protein S13